MEYVKGKKYRIKSVNDNSDYYLERDQWIGKEMYYHGVVYGNNVRLSETPDGPKIGYSFTLEDIEPVVGKRYTIKRLADDDAYVEYEGIVGRSVVVTKLAEDCTWVRFDHPPNRIAGDINEHGIALLTEGLVLQEITTPPIDPLQEAWENYDDQIADTHEGILTSGNCFEAGWHAALEWRNKQ